MEKQGAKACKGTLVPHTKDVPVVWIVKGFLDYLTLFLTYACVTGNKKPASICILSNKELRKEKNSFLGGTEQGAGTMLDDDAKMFFSMTPALEVSTLKFKGVNYLFPGLLNCEVQQ